MRLTQVLRLALVLGATAVALGGCGGDKDTNVGMVPAVTSPITDVPVPAGYTLEMDKSISHVVPGNLFRSVNHEYKGPGYAMPVVRFYKDQLPGKGWTLVDQSEVKGRYSLRFTQKKEDCTVSVWEGYFNTHIGITIGPSAASAAKN